MKRRLHLMMVSVCAAGLFGAPHAYAVDAAPTDIAIAWDTSTGTPKIKVTWQDSPDTPNRVQYAGGSPFRMVVIGPSEPNTALLSPGDAPAEASTLRISVEVGDAAGATSPPSASAEFDRNLEGWSDFTVVPHADTFTLTWRNPEVPDPNPGDPLDVFPTGWPFNRVSAIFCFSVDDKVQGTSYTSVRGRSRPGIWEVGALNPWGGAGGGFMLYATAVSTAVPSATSYSKPVAIAGTSRLYWYEQGWPWGSCPRREHVDPGRLVHLQARNSSTSPWYGVATTTTAADGTFRFAPVAIGTRQFRGVESSVPYPNSKIDGAQMAGISPAATANTMAWVRSARFLDPAIRRGEKSTAHVWVSPGVSTTALLQRWSSTGWVGVKQMPMFNGVAQYRFTPAATSTWRWVIPTTRGPNGLTIAWTATRPFSITVP